MKTYKPCWFDECATLPMFRLGQDKATLLPLLISWEPDSKTIWFVSPVPEGIDDWATEIKGQNNNTLVDCTYIIYKNV